MCFGRILDLELLINDDQMGGVVKNFVTTVYKPEYKTVRGVKNCPNLRDVIYGRPRPVIPLAIKIIGQCLSIKKTIKL